MANHSHNKHEIVSRYATAIYELTEEQKCTDKVEPFLESVVNTFNSFQDLRKIVNNPSTSQDAKGNVITNIFLKKNQEKIVENFLQTLIKNRRLDLLPDIANEYFVKKKKFSGEIDVYVSTAKDLSEKQKKSLHKEIESALNSQVSIHFKLDSNAIGGIRLQIGSQMIDSTISSQLNKLKLTLKEQ